MTLPQPDYWPDRSFSRTAVLATGVAVSVGALAFMLWSAEQRALAARPRDSAPSRVRKAGLAEGSALSAAVTITATPRQIIESVTRHEDGEALARDIQGMKRPRSFRSTIQATT